MGLQRSGTPLAPTIAEHGLVYYGTRMRIHLSRRYGHHGTAIVIGGLFTGFALVVATVIAGMIASTNTPPAAHAATLRQEFGAVSFISSLSAGSRSAGVAALSDAGLGWAREEVTYSPDIDFAPYDDAIDRLRGAGVRILVLLTYPGNDRSHDDWKTYVDTVVTRYADRVDAWEIMNEADNYLSASDYVTYLTEAHEIIGAKDASSTIVSTGITSRIEATSYLDGIAAAGGWGKFDAVGLHVYHSGYPEKVNFGGGNLTAEFSRIAGVIAKHGSKKIWVTETGYRSDVDGNTNQANWLARSLVMARGVAAVDKVFVYRLYDHGEGYGLTTSNLGEKDAFARVRDITGYLGGRGTGTQLFPQEKATLDSFSSSPGGWSPERSVNAGVVLESATGYSGNGLRIKYDFSADSAYALVEKSGLSAGDATAFAAWIYGDDTSNVWKFRFVDAKGETFQVDLGSIASGWQYKQFTIGQDTAMVHWDGDGTIDYPVSFRGIVVDRQGSTGASGSGIVDELIAIRGSADLYAYQFGDAVAYWKAQGESSASLCGASRQFTESPAYATGVDCADTPVTSGGGGAEQTATSSSSTRRSRSTRTSVPAPIIPADPATSLIRLDGENVLADGQQSYRIVVSLRDKDGHTLDRAPSIALTGGQTTANELRLVGGEWLMDVTSTEPGERQAIITSEGVELATLTLTFIEPPVAATGDETTPPPTTRAAAASTTKTLFVLTGCLLLAGAGFATWRRYRRHGRSQ